MIYFITDGTYTKVGYTKEECVSTWFNRVSQLQTANARALRVVGLIANKGVKFEKALHKRLSEYRVNGEWFDLRTFDLDDAFNKMFDAGIEVYDIDDIKEVESDELELIEHAYREREKKQAAKLEENRKSKWVEFFKEQEANKVDWIKRMNKYQINESL